LATYSVFVYTVGMTKAVRLAITLAGYDSVAEMSKAIGINRAELSMIFSGRLVATEPRRERIAKALGLKVEELFATSGMVVDESSKLERSAKRIIRERAWDTLD